MPEPLYVLVNFVMIFIEIISFAMMIRAILSWFVEGDNAFTRFLFVITEPAIMPIRKLFHKMNWFQEVPIDVSFSFTFIALFLVQMLLGALI